MTRSEIAAVEAAQQRVCWRAIAAHHYRYPSPRAVVVPFVDAVTLKRQRTLRLIRERVARYRARLRQERMAS